MQQILLRSEDMGPIFIEPLRNTSDLLAHTSDNYLCTLTLCTSTDSGVYRYSPPPQKLNQESMLTQHSSFDSL